MTDATIIETAVKQAGAITPMLGSVGHVTAVCLWRNTLIAAARRRGVTNRKI